MLEDGYFNPHKPFTVRWGDLPHWRQESATYFVTFRLCDSLPLQRLQEWRRERDEWRDAHLNPSADELEQFSLRHRATIEKWLDLGSGSCVLNDPEAREILERTVGFFEGVRYEAGPLAVAPNHVHVLVRTAPSFDLSDVLHSWKRQSSREIRSIPRLRERAPRNTEHLWQIESFDHIVRSGEHLERFAAYINGHALRFNKIGR